MPSVANIYVRTNPFITNNYPFKMIGKIIYKSDFSDQFRKAIIRDKRYGYNINVMRQSTFLAINPITVDSLASLFNCAPVSRASDSIIGPT